MPSATPQTGMFHRRVALVFALVAVGMAPVAVQTARLTLVQGDEHRAEAEAALVSMQWLPTRRGQILDRKGRVLAKDRPSYEILAEYDMIAGGRAWAQARAGRIARQHSRATWGDLSADQRRAKVDLYMPALIAHAEQVWPRLAEATGAPIDQIQRRRDEVVRGVDRRFSAVFRSRLTQEIDAQLQLGREITTDVEEEARRRAGRDIEEQRSPHVVVPRVADAMAFEIQRMVEQRVTIAVPHPDGGTVGLEVPLLPGVTVEATGDREYPLESVSVGVDLATLPTPVRGSGVRTIALEGVGYHVLGRMRGRVTREDNERRAAALAADASLAARSMTSAGAPGDGVMLDRGAYRDDDDAGLGGIEEAREDDLRGLRGLVFEQRETGERRQIDAEPGRDVSLTIDIMLQARVQAAMSPELGLAVAQRWHSPQGQENPTVPVGTPLDGAAVVLDIDSGEILAMVSMPSIPRRLLEGGGASVFEDPLARAVSVPWVDRAVSRPYPPGSIAKALVLNEAVRLGRHSLSTPISCTGHLYPDRPNMFRCWIFKQHTMTHDSYFGHAPNAIESLMVSCNIYFFTLGQKLGPEGIVGAYRRFGLGQPLGLGLEKPGEDFVEFPGYLGLTREGLPASATEPGRVSPSDAVQMGIGQGPVAWTPVHAADAYATIARGGVRVRPHLLAGVRRADAEDLGLDPAAVQESLEGLRLAVADDRGTGHHLTLEGGVKEPHFNVPGVDVWGKTGTATAPTLFAPRDTKPGDPLFLHAIDAAALLGTEDTPAPRSVEGRRVLRHGDHSWFVVLAGRAGEGRPRYAVAVLMEYAGSGGKVSGPIANQIVHALRAEGYL